MGAIVEGSEKRGRRELKGDIRKRDARGGKKRNRGTEE